MPANLENSAMATGLENVSFYSNPKKVQFSLVAQSHVRLPCLSPIPGACSNSCPLSWLPSNHLILCCPLLLLTLVFPSIRAFSSESALPIRWPKYWSFSFSISSSKEYSWLISFRIDWFDLLAVQGTLKIFSKDSSQRENLGQESFLPSSSPCFSPPFLSFYFYYFLFSDKILKKK